MSTLSDLIETGGDEAKELIKQNLLTLIEQAKAETESIAKETGEKIEEWLELKLLGEISESEFDQLLSSRRRAVAQFLNSQSIAARARLEKTTIGLIDFIVDKVIDTIV